jgi:hypothetical protein
VDLQEWNPTDWGQKGTIKRMYAYTERRGKWEWRRSQQRLGTQRESWIENGRRGSDDQVELLWKKADELYGRTLLRWLQNDLTKPASEKTVIEKQVLEGMKVIREEILRLAQNYWPTKIPCSGHEREDSP